MPETVKITVINKIYNTPLLTPDMVSKYDQILSVKSEITGLKDHLNNAMTNLGIYQNELIALYIQQTGSFPE